MFRGKLLSTSADMEFPTLCLFDLTIIFIENLKKCGKFWKKRVKNRNMEHSIQIMNESFHVGYLELFQLYALSFCNKERQFWYLDLYRVLSSLCGHMKDFLATQVRCLTATTAAVTVAFLFVEMLCYVLGRLHSSCVLCTKIGLHR